MTTLNGDYYTNIGLSLATPLKNPRIGYDNQISSVSASSSQAGFTADAMETPFTYEIWKPATFPAVITADMGQVRTIDYVGFAAHEFKDCTLSIAYSMDGASYTDIQQATITDNRAIMLLFAPVQARYIRVTVTGFATESTFLSDFVNSVYSESTYSATETGGASCSVMYAGQALAMQRMIYGGHSPAVLSRKTKLDNATSEGGQFVGRSVVRQSLTTTFDFQNLTADWYRVNFDPFVNAARTAPFFVSWRPEGYANETVFGYTNDDITPQNQGVRDFLSVSFSMTGHHGAE